MAYCEKLFNILTLPLIITECWFVFLAPDTKLIHDTSLCIIFICLCSSLYSKRVADAFWQYRSFIIAVIGCVATFVLYLRERQIL